MPDALHTLLKDWEVHPGPDPRFRAAVWRRIEKRQQGLLFRFWRRTEQFVGQPAAAALVVAAMLLAGGVSGTAWRQRETNQERASGLKAYVLAVNPVAYAATLRP